MINTIKKTDLKFSKIFIVIVLILNYCYALYVFSSPERAGLFNLVMFFPAIVALVLNSIRYRSIKTVFRPLTHKINFKSILFSTFYPLVFIGIVAIAVTFIGLAELNKDKLSNLAELPSVEILVFGFLLMFGEEYGWRGFLLKHLTEAKGKLFGATVVGVVWAFWHAPMVYGLAIHSNMENPLLLVMMQMGAVFVFSIPFAYSYFLTNNIIPPMLFHFVWNYYNPIVLGNIYHNRPGIVVGNLIYINGEGLAGIILGSLFFIWFVARTKKRKKNFENISINKKLHKGAGNQS